jgi:predicted amidohydrolase
MPLELRLRLWATNLATQLSGLDAWLDRVRRQLVAARAAGASLLVLPEYASAQWLAFAPPLETRRELAWLAELAETAVPALRVLARSEGVALMAGTFPWRLAQGQYVNRAMLFWPDGEGTQDKLALTPWEREEEGWQLASGSSVSVMDWGGVRVAIAICMDVEVPSIAAHLVERAVDLLLVPSMTSSRAGYGRVFTCAKARAVELSCPVAVVGTVGTLALPAREEPNVSGAALYVPCEPGSEDGVVAAMGPFAEDDGEGPTLDVTVPIGRCRALRDFAAEVWPPKVPASFGG